MLLGICLWREPSETAIGTDRRAGKWGLVKRLFGVGGQGEAPATRLGMGALGEKRLRRRVPSSSGRLGEATLPAKKTPASGEADVLGRV